MNKTVYELLTSFREMGATSLYIIYVNGERVESDYINEYVSSEYDSEEVTDWFVNLASQVRIKVKQEVNMKTLYIYRNVITFDQDRMNEYLETE